MLSRIPMHRHGALGPIIRRYVAPACSHRRLLSDSPPAPTAAAKDRRWVMLSSDGRRRLPDSSSFFTDPNTVAESLTSKGRRVRVSFRCAAPPSSSYLYYEFLERSDDPNHYDYDDADRIRVVAAHGELVLLKMSNSGRAEPEDYFVYRPAGACRPPSLSLLPILEFATKPDSVPPINPRLDNGSIGLLRRGDNDLLVVHVHMWHDWDARCRKAVFSVLRHGLRRWEILEPVPVFQCGWSSSPQKAICVGDRLLCCIWYGSSFLLCDMADEASPKVQYVGLPLEVTCCSYGNDQRYGRPQHIGAAGDSRVRFVSIHPDCCRSVDPDRDLYSNDRYYYKDCCCNQPRTECWHPRFVFTMKTWTMNLSMDEPLEWVEDGVIDGEEIWALPGYEGLPQAIPEWLVVCMDNVVCFTVSNYHFTKDVEKVWMVHLNIKTKTLLSVAQLDRNDHYQTEYYHLSAEFQY